MIDNPWQHPEQRVEPGPMCRRCETEAEPNGLTLVPGTDLCSMCASEVAAKMVEEYLPEFGDDTEDAIADLIVRMLRHQADYLGTFVVSLDYKRRAALALGKFARGRR